MALQDSAAESTGDTNSTRHCHNRAGTTAAASPLMAEAVLAIHARQLHGFGLHMQHNADKNHIEASWPGLLEDLQDCIALKACIFTAGLPSWWCC